MFIFTSKKEKQFTLFTYSMHAAITIGSGTRLIDVKDNYTKWGMKDAASQRARLTWMLQEGERKEFARLHHFMTALSESGRKEYIDSLESDQERIAKAKVVQFYMRRLPAEGIAAYDYTWASFLSRGKGDYGYISKEEARQFQLQAVRQTQQAYNNWGEFFTGYIAGYQFMTAQTSLDYLRENEWEFTRYFVSKHSSILKVNFHEDFSHFE
ncbi:DUF1266 domain-containing protein [Brevibacillus sp. MER 51]|uniref:DUF1266 domain-containing protein n=1 Tax=Brevibacillus sp. MER 51 TaxID=2939560 RepID=UPI00204234DF|nr:DUF1266 domain-containing protein [Brevibacillus sp. MER 51]MCM3143955.1 DUF1266 domain-containing protein [Brevibacillus sp. MER 51]